MTTTDIERAYNALKAKLPYYTTLFDYADGKQPLQYSTQKLHEIFSNINAHFEQNWITVVLDSALDKLIFKGWNAKNKAINDRLDKLYTQLNLRVESDDIMEAALTTHEAYLIVWLEDGEIDAFYNDPRMVHMFYDSVNPHKKEFAAKWFINRDGFYEMTLYYPDRIEYYIARKKTQGGAVPSSAKEFMPKEVPQAENPYGQIPVFHFRINHKGNVSDISKVLTLQDAVNKTLADMMVAAEFGAFAQRYVITNSDTRALKNAPNEIWQIPIDETGTTQVGQFAPTNLSNFLDSIDKLATAIATIARVPKHYFFSMGSNPSGEALMALEAPLIARVEKHQSRFQSTFVEVAQFLLLLSGIAIGEEEIDVVFEPAQSIQPFTEAQTIKTLREAGLPLATILRWAGKDETEIANIEKEIATEKKNTASMADMIVERLKAQQDHSPEDAETPTPPQPTDEETE